MQSRRFLLPAVLACALLVSCHSSERGAGSRAAAALRPLNLVVVTLDTLRPDHLHCYGYPRIETPVTDGLAQGGVLFENAVTQAPLTAPSHASLFTGLNPPTHRVRDTGGFMLPAGSATLATRLQGEGWNTAAFVSSAVLKKRFGLNQGFSVYDDEMPRPGSGQEFQADAERRGGDTVNRAVTWLASAPDKPFFLWVHLFDPHTPYNPPSPFRERYQGRPYDGEIAYDDQQLGRLLEAVRKKSPADRTLIAVLSDHGESLGEHGEFSHGVFLYDSTLRIAFLLSGPGVPAGLRIKQQVRAIDFLPTILELMGGRPPAAVEGASLVPALSGKETATDVSYAESLYPKINMGWAELRAIRTNRWKYVRAPKPELYDLAQDPAEAHNVIAAHPSEVRKFEARLNAVVNLAAGEKVETAAVDEHTLAQLKSLGYTSGFSSPSYNLTGQGADPKDRVEILRLMEQADRPQTPAPRVIAALERAVRLDPGNPLIYYSLGAAYEKAGRYADAVLLYRAAVRNGISSGRLHSRIADLLVRAGKKDEAIPEYETAMRLNPADSASQANLATAYLEKGRLPDAQRVYQAILTVDPGYAAAYNGLGVIAIQRQDPNAARGYFEKAVALDPNQVEAQLNLGLLYKINGDRARARACFEAFLAKASPRQYAEVIPKVREELAALR